MNLTPWKGKRRENLGELGWPGSTLGTLRSEMDRLFDRFFGGMWSDEPGLSTGLGFLPSLDVSETEKEITVRAELPGVDPKDLNITISGQTLTLSGEKQESVERKDENFFHSERRFGSFRRTVQLPTPVDSEKVNAEFKNGVIHIRMEKVQAAIPKRITVRGSKN